jgi:hypothetical protein
MSEFIVRDVRLHGWRPNGDTLEVNYDTPLSWVIKNIKSRANSNLVVKFMSHGLPGYLQFANGTKTHPQVGNGITIADLPSFNEIKGCLKRLEFHACLVARIGACPECDGLTAYDGNHFCYRMAQTIQAEVKASLHVQIYGTGNSPTAGIDFGKWQGRVFTWGPQGNVINTEDFPYN